MTEYIKREKVYEMLNDLGGCGAEPESWADGWDKAIDTAIEELDKLPAADVQEVKHGEWVRVSDGDQYEGCYFCSECKEEYFNPSDDENMLPNFCPNCGAKMDGKDGKNENI